MWRGIMVLEREMTVNKEYEELVRKFLGEMDVVKADFADFVDGLEHAYSEIESRLEVARDELRRMNRGK